MEKPRNDVAMFRQLVDEEIDFIVHEIVARQKHLKGNGRKFISFFGPSLAACDEIGRKLYVLQAGRQGVIPAALKAEIAEWLDIGSQAYPTKKGLRERIKDALNETR